MPISLKNFNADIFCKSVIDDTLRLSNKNVAIEFIWFSDKIVPSIVSKFRHYSAKYIALNLQIHSNAKSIAILPSYSFQYFSDDKNTINHGLCRKLQENDVKIKYLIFGYLRQHQIL
eukprot:148066_1